MTGMALGLSPLLPAIRAYCSRVERVPSASAGAIPTAVRRWFPFTFWAVYFHCSLLLIEINSLLITVRMVGQIFDSFLDGHLL